jgi:hypothetical protein
MRTELPGVSRVRGSGRPLHTNDDGRDEKVEDPMNNKLLMPVLMLAGGFMILAIWRNPAVAAQDVGNVLGNVGNFLQELLAKLAEFFGNLGS